MARLLTMALAVVVMAIPFGPVLAEDDQPDSPAADEAPVRKAGPARYAEPEPSIIPLSWQLDVKVQKVGRVVVDVAGSPVYYWYVIYTVSNPSNRPVDLMPRIKMLTDSLDSHPAILAMNPELFKLIKESTKSKYLEEPLQISRVLGGADNARDTVAVFALKGDPKWFRVFFAGFSGEQRKVVVPGKEPGQSDEVTMEKIKVAEFAVPGNYSRDVIPQVHSKAGSEKWTMAVMPPQVKMAVDLQRARQGQDPIYVDDGSRPHAPAPKTEPEQPKAEPATSAAEPAEAEPQPVQPEQSPDAAPAPKPAAEIEK